MKKTALCLTLLTCAAAACKDGPDGDSSSSQAVSAAGTAGAELTDPSEATPLQNIDSISVAADSASGRVVIAAPPGSLSAHAGTAVYVWEAGPGPLGRQFVSEGNHLHLAAELRDTVHTTVDGAFTGEVVMQRHGVVILSTAPVDPNAHGLVLQSGDSITAAYADAFRGDFQLQPLRDADFALEGDTPETNGAEL